MAKKKESRRQDGNHRNPHTSANGGHVHTASIIGTWTLTFTLTLTRHTKTHTESSLKRNREKYTAPFPPSPVPNLSPSLPNVDQDQKTTKMKKKRRRRRHEKNHSKCITRTPSPVSRRGKPCKCSDRRQIAEPSGEQGSLFSLPPSFCAERRFSFLLSWSRARDLLPPK